MSRRVARSFLIALAANGLACMDDFTRAPESCQARGEDVFADRTAPTVSFVQPADHATTVGVVQLIAAATDNCHVSTVRFIDFNGRTLGTAIRAADGHTFGLRWDTRTVGNGPITLAVYASDSHRDTDGNPTPNTGFAERTFTVANP